MNDAGHPTAYLGERIDAKAFLPVIHEPFNSRGHAPNAVLIVLGRLYRWTLIRAGNPAKNAWSVQSSPNSGTPTGTWKRTSKRIYPRGHLGRRSAVRGAGHVVGGLPSTRARRPRLAKKHVDPFDDGAKARVLS